MRLGFALMASHKGSKGCEDMVFLRGRCQEVLKMHMFIKSLVAVSSALLVAGALAQSTVVNVTNEPAPTITLLPPLPGPLAQGVVFIPYKLENLRIVPVGGTVAREISPRVGHLHVTLDDLPWQWADYGGSNTVILVGLSSGDHKIRVEVMDPEGHPYTEKSLPFTVPAAAGRR